MSAAREAFVLPLVFLTVALLGGVRTGGNVRLLAPLPVALVSAILLLGCLVRAGALSPARLISEKRSPLENASGAVVFLTLVAASAQIFSLLTPEHGLLHLVFSVFFLVQLLTTMTSAPGRRGLLRGLAVLFGSAFLLRYVALESLYSPDPGTAKRVLTAMIQGVTLGSLQYEANTPATGYAALLAVTLFLWGLVMLPYRSEAKDVHRRQLPPAGNGMIVALVLLCIAGSGCSGRPRDPGQSNPVTNDETPASPSKKQAPGAMELRERALRAARVWRSPATPIPAVDFADNPGGKVSFGAAESVSCRFVLDPVGGTTPKFNCELKGGEVVKVKYGSANPELEAEVAASRLLSALGFGSDQMYVVRAVRCFGCPRFPFRALKCLADTGLVGACLPGGLDFNHAVDFDPAAIERAMEGTRIEGIKDQGWAWYELSRIDPAHGGSPRAEVDALRLMAVFLAHWDNKAGNQRLVCLPGGQRADGSCTRPFALVHDLGATFGPYKVDLPNWRATPMWVDPGACRISMKTLPFGGATFPDVQVSEEGRRLVLSLLEQLSDEQIRDLFTVSRITRLDTLSARARNAEAWLAAFRDKIRQLREGGPCPPARELTSPPA